MDIGDRQRRSNIEVIEISEELTQNKGRKINTKNNNSRNFTEKKKDLKFHTERTHNIPEHIYSEQPIPDIVQ